MLDVAGCGLVIQPHAMQELFIQRRLLVCYSVMHRTRMSGTSALEAGASMNYGLFELAACDFYLLSPISGATMAAPKRCGAAASGAYVWRFALMDNQQRHAEYAPAYLPPSGAPGQVRRVPAV